MRHANHLTAAPAVSFRSRWSERLRQIVLWLMLTSVGAASLVQANTATVGSGTASTSSASASSALPGMGGGSAPSSSGVNWRICERPPVCFGSDEARRQWARDNQCQFLEDVCQGPRDNQPPPEEDRGFWGSLWDGVKSGLTQGYNFVKGLVAGMKDQVEGLISLVTDFGDILNGLIALGKAFIQDPQGTLQKLGELIGQDIVDTIYRATQCGAYDTGKVIGENVSPVLVLKLAGKIGKYSGNLARAVRETKHDLGCASFGAGTRVLTEAGYTPIEQIQVGQSVLSRHDGLFTDEPRRVKNTFGRVAPHHHALVTEHDTVKVTDEHPVWLQGEGWVAVKDVQRGDVIATAQGDTSVLSNERIDKPIEVFNFSVEDTPSYFVGHGLWVHNASCDLSKRWPDLSAKEKGFRAELEVAALLDANGYKPVGGTFDIKRYPDVDSGFAAWDGQTGIDGIYKNAKGEYVIIESKGKGTAVKDDPSGCVDKLCNTNDGRQLSLDWTVARLEKLIPDPVERARVERGLRNGTVKRVYAQTDENGTVFHEVATPTGAGGPNTRDAVIGGEWKP